MISGRQAATRRTKAAWLSTWRSISRTSWPEVRAAAATSSSPSGSSRRKILVYISGPGWTPRTFMPNAPLSRPPPYPPLDARRKITAAVERSRELRLKFRAASNPAGLHLQQPLHVAVQQLLLVLAAQRQGFQPFRAGLVVDKRVVDREQDTVDPHLHHAAQQRRVGEEAAGRDPEMFAERVA